MILLILSSCNINEVDINETEMKFVNKELLFYINSKPFNGLVKEKYPNNNLKLEMYITNGLKNGLVIQYYINGTTKTVSNFINGKQNGSFN